MISSSQSFKRYPCPNLTDELSWKILRSTISLSACATTAGRRRAERSRVSEQTSAADVIEQSKSWRPIAAITKLDRAAGVVPGFDTRFDPKGVRLSGCESIVLITTGRCSSLWMSYRDHSSLKNELPMKRPTKGLSMPSIGIFLVLTGGFIKARAILSTSLQSL